MARRQDIEKRARILDAAYVIFGELGYRNTTIKDIARRAGVAAGSIYTYFPDKENLYAATVEEGWDRFLRVMENEAAGKGSFEDKLSVLLDVSFVELKAAYLLMNGMFNQPGRSRLYKNHIDKLCDGIDQIFNGSAAQSLSDVQKDARMFFLRIAVSGVLFTLAITPPEEIDRELEALKTGIRNSYLTGTPVPV